MLGQAQMGRKVLNRQLIVAWGKGKVGMRNSGKWVVGKPLPSLVSRLGFMPGIHPPYPTN